MNKIQKARIKKGWTQEELAKKLGVTDGAVSQWELGNFKPRKETRVLMKQVLFDEAKVSGKVTFKGDKQFTVKDHPDWIALHSKKAQIFLGWDQEGNERYSWTTRQAGEAMLKTMKKYKCYPKDQLGLFATMCGGKVEPHLLQEWCDFIKKIRSK